MCFVMVLDNLELVGIDGAGVSHLRGMGCRSEVAPLIEGAHL